MLKQKHFLITLFTILICLSISVSSFAIGNPFGSGGTSNAGDGNDGNDCVDTNPNLGLSFNNLNMSDFPCDLHIAVTYNGSTVHLDVDVDDFTAQESTNGETYYYHNYGDQVYSLFDNIEFDTTNRVCDGILNLFTFDLELVCFDGENYSPIDYCEEQEMWEPFFQMNCSDSNISNITSTARSRLCCPKDPWVSEELEQVDWSVGRNDDGDGGGGDTGGLVVFSNGAALNIFIPHLESTNETVIEKSLYNAVIRVFTSTGQLIYDEIKLISKNQYTVLDDLNYKGLCFVSTTINGKTTTKKLYLY